MISDSLQSRVVREAVAIVVLLQAFALLASGQGGVQSVEIGSSDGKDSVRRRIIPVAEISFRPAATLRNKDFFRGENASGKPISSTFSSHLKYGFRFNPESDFGKFALYSVQGIGIAGNTFFNSSEMGNPLALFVFQTSRLATLSERLSIDYEWNFGASFGWKEYDEATNPYNNVVGSKINAYINVGFLLDWRVGTHLGLKAGVGLTHFSNGNTNYPNAGVNTAGGSFSLVWDFGNEQERLRSGMFGFGQGYASTEGSEATTGQSFGNKRLGFFDRVDYDVVVYGALKKKGFMWDENTPVIISGLFAVAGINITPLYSVSKHLRAGLSLDAQYDESANIIKHLASTEAPVDGNVKFHRPPFAEQFAVGISARAEIVMPIFSINFGIGRNIICKGSDTDSFYQIFALKAFVSRRAFIHIGYQLYKFDNPNNLMIGLGWRFGSRFSR